MSTLAPESATVDHGHSVQRGFVQKVLGAGPVLALVALLIAFSLLSQRFMSLGNLQSILDQAAILLVLAVGSTFVILLGGIDLSLEGVMATASLVTVLVALNDRNANDLGWIAFAAGIGVGALMGLANGVLTTYVRIPSFMVTLGMGAIGLGIATVLFAGQPPRLLDENLRALGLDRWLGISRLVLVAVLVLAIGWFVQRFTRIGRYAYVIGGDEEIARLSGIQIRKYKILAFTISGCTAGLAGAMAAARLGVGDVLIGQGQLFTAITAVVVGGTLLAGGKGGVLHSLVGVLLICVLSNGLILVGVPSTVQQSVQGVVVIIAVAATGWRLRHRLRVVK